MATLDRILELVLRLAILVVVGVLSTVGIWTVFSTPAPLSYFPIGVTSVALMVIAVFAIVRIR